jgi:glucosamine--fructose-6-phosphate aminotransferase (isomerizing)
MQVLIHAGPEMEWHPQAFTTQITVLTMIALQLAKAKGPFHTQFSYVFARTRINSEKLEALETNDKAKEMLKPLKMLPNCLYLGRVIISSGS